MLAVERSAFDSETNVSVTFCLRTSRILPTASQSNLLARKTRYLRQPRDEGVKSWNFAAYPNGSPEHQAAARRDRLRFSSASRAASS